MPDKFFNPYAFVPALPRDGVTGDLGDRAPTGHDRFHENRISGRIEVTLTTVTPLLIPDAGRRTEVPGAPDHFLYPLRVDGKGAPYLPPTSVKGMLRAAYEAVTNSRLSMFKGHEEALGFRRSAIESTQQHIQAARVENGVLRMLDALPVRRYDVEEGRNIKGLPSAGAEVWCRTVRNPATRTDEVVEVSASSKQGQREWRRGWAHVTGRNIDRKKSERVFAEPGFEETKDLDRSLLKAYGGRLKNKPVLCRVYRDQDNRWVVAAIVAHDESLPDDVGQRTRCSELRGYLHFREEGRKQIPVVWIGKGGAHAWHPLADLPAKWDALMTEYLRSSKGRIEDPSAAPDDTELSRHLRDPAARRLTEGTLCWVRLENRTPTALYPVAISRDRYENAPLDLLSDTLRPASDRQRLSPADRVFGWVKDDGHGAHRGQLRVGPVICETADPVMPFVSETNPHGLPLAILGAPKPEQARFYAAQDEKGTPLPDQGSKADGYRNPGVSGLRGRKVYPHHGDLPKNYWPVTPRQRPLLRQQGGPLRHQAFLRLASQSGDTPAPLRDKQNRSIAAWVREGVTFSFSIHVTNLSHVELGALLWLLDLDRWEPGHKHFHRLGGGKPLGFGSVRMTVTNCELADQESLKARYRSLRSPQTAAGIDKAPLVGEFHQACVNAYAPKTTFKNVPFIKAFLAAARGRSAFPTHYPTVQVRGDQHTPAAPVAESYKWFVRNEANQDYRLSLPELSEGEEGALPVYTIDRF